MEHIYSSHNIFHSDFFWINNSQKIDHAYCDGPYMTHTSCYLFTTFKRSRVAAVRKHDTPLFSVLRCIHEGLTAALWLELLDSRCTLAELPV